MNTRQQEEYCTYHPGEAAAGTCSGCGRPFCQGCLVILGDGRSYCRPCAGAALEEGVSGPGGMAVASLIFSAASVLFCSLASVPGLVLGLVELNRIKQGRSPQSGHGLALAGVIIGALVAAFVLLMMILFGAMTLLGTIIGLVG